MQVSRKVEMVVVGARHAGLVMSHLLSRGGRDHVVLDGRPKSRPRLAGSLGRFPTRYAELDRVLPRSAL